MAYSSVRNGVGSSSNRFRMSLANKNYTTQYFKMLHASGDIRGYYLHARYQGAGGGEVQRAVAEAYGTDVATGATVNAAHFTGRVGSGTVSGALNGVRITLEAATGLTPGGTLAALQLDDNIGANTTMGGNDAFIRVTHSGSVELVNLLNLPAPGAKTAAATDMFVARHADATATHAIKITDDAGTDYWLMVTTDTPGD